MKIDWCVPFVPFRCHPFDWDNNTFTHIYNTTRSTNNVARKKQRKLLRIVRFVGWRWLYRWDWVAVFHLPFYKKRSKWHRIVKHYSLRYWKINKILLQNINKKTRQNNTLFSSSNFTTQTGLTVNPTANQSELMKCRSNSMLRTEHLVFAHTFNIRRHGIFGQLSTRWSVKIKK